MTIEGNATDRYAVVGHPIGHSRSPFVHGLFARQTGEAMRYEALDVPPEAFEERVHAFLESGGRGLNVTVPLKELAFAFATTLTGRAERAGAVNTLRFDPECVLGDNTDGVGLVRDLESNLGVRLQGARVLVLGAGGAARGVLGPLLDRSPRELVIANRTVQRARELALRFAADGAVSHCALDSIPGGGFDLVINATATGITGGALPLDAHGLRHGATCYDMMYAPRPTAFLERARGAGAALLADGRGMLVEQAAESFFLWRGVRPETAPVIRALGEALSSPGEP